MWCLRARGIDPGELDDDHAPAGLWSGPLSVKLGSGLRRVMHMMRSRQRACMWLHTGHRGGACPISVFGVSAIFFQNADLHNFKTATLLRIISRISIS